MWRIFPSSIRRNPRAFKIFGKTQNHPAGYMLRKFSRDEWRLTFKSLLWARQRGSLTPAPIAGEETAFSTDPVIASQEQKGMKIFLQLWFLPCSQSQWDLGAKVLTLKMVISEWKSLFRKLLPGTTGGGWIRAGNTSWPNPRVESALQRKLRHPTGRRVSPSGLFFPSQSG